MSEAWTWLHTGVLVVGWSGGMVTATILTAWQDARIARRNRNRRR
jgi:hypothetical protein